MKKLQDENKIARILELANNPTIENGLETYELFLWRNDISGFQIKNLSTQDEIIFFKDWTSMGINRKDTIKAILDTYSK